ncbi:ribonuclease H-like domain-containing protein [Mycena filopes]|nr:ribonuclease H-like domain-containing protein [Mycena filopes]
MDQLWLHFHRGDKKNDNQYHTYCKACVADHLTGTGATTTDLTQGSQAFQAACAAVGSIRGEKSAMVAHLIGGREACSHASAEAKADATAVRKATADAKESKELKKRPRADSTASPSAVAEPPKKKHQENPKSPYSPRKTTKDMEDLIAEARLYRKTIIPGPPLHSIPDFPDEHTQGTLSSLVFRRNDMPFGADEKDAVQKQALRAVVSSGTPLQFFEDTEVKILFGMLRTTAPEILPTAKVVGGRLLDSAAADVDAKTIKVMNGRKTGLSTDGWKTLGKDAVNALCANVDFQAYLLELIDITDPKKDGQSQCDLFAAMIDRVELKYGCVVIYFTTDADGGSKKGRFLLGKERPWLILPSCWAHQFQLILGDYFKVNDAAAGIAEEATGLIAWINNHGRVRKIFNKAQGIVSQDQNAGKIIILAYLVANLTRWTTHFTAFRRLWLLRRPLLLAVHQSRTAIIDAEVGAAVSTEGERLRQDAEKHCTLIEDPHFWSGLETVLGDLEPICLGTNINQKDSTRLDQVLLTIAGIFLRFADHAEAEVRTSMLKRLEKRWKDCDQPVFLLALILNPFEKLTCFGPAANLNQLKCGKLLVLLYRRINAQPDNDDTPAERVIKEKALSKSFMQYLAGTGDFTDFDPVSWEEIYENTDPIRVWEALEDSTHLADLAKFAITILSIVANQAGCERTFSRTKIEQADHRNRLSLDKMDKRTKVRADIRAGHAKDDLLADQDHEDPSERGRALVSTTDGWRVQMAKWIGDAKAAEREEQTEEHAGGMTFADDESTENDVAQVTAAPGWKPLTLAVLFGGAEKPRARKALADEEEAARPDDGAIEIDSGDEYHT